MKIIKETHDKSFHIQDGDHTFTVIKGKCTLCGDYASCLEISYDVLLYRICSSCLEKLSGYLSVINDKD